MASKAPRGMTTNFMTTADPTMHAPKKSTRSAAASALTQSPNKPMTTTLKKQGGSLVATVPAPARSAMHLDAETVMTVTVDGNRLILEPALPPRPIYTLEERLAMCDFDAPLTDEENAWLSRPPVGREVF